MANTFSWWSILNIVIGAIIGALVSYLLQRNSFREAREQKEKDRLEERKATAYALFFKMIKIASGFHNLTTHFSGSIVKARKAGHELAPWQIVLPMANSFDPIKYTAEEMALLLSLNVNLFNQACELDDFHNAAIKAAAFYGEKRPKLTDKLTPEMSGGIGSMRMSAEQLREIEPQAYELNSLIEQISAMTEVDAKSSSNCLFKLSELLQQEFKMPVSIVRRAEQAVPNNS